MFGLSDLAVPARVGDGCGIALADGGAQRSAPSFDLLLRRDENGGVHSRFQEHGFRNRVITTLERGLLTVPVGADQVELRLERADPDSDAVTAADRFRDGGASVGDWTTLSRSADFFRCHAWGRGPFFAVEAVPEPGPLGLLLAVGAALLPSSGRHRGLIRRSR